MGLGEGISVITPTIVGREDRLEECKASVINQTVPVLEHLCKLDVDKVGPSEIRNRLVAHSRGDWVAFLDDDDLLYPNHFESHIPFMDDYDVIFSWCYVVEKDGQKKEFKSRYQPNRLKKQNTIPVTATVRKSAFDSVGGFSNNDRFEDWGLWKRLMDSKATFKCVMDFTWEYRMTPNSRNSEVR